ncbi:DUF3221 domain-containing protein [Pueribacillus theae]|uniref:DUF3221 domain-containing protein n=1 Tax=Pueribacillus theae TaxID=2171751 RepID=A0A2U1JXP3_9BACI|nr:DUF3221 domain-containing protein [Pueribacillus theae]PWA09996.1 DUF3221 domain-containing protein [Pueribacillus theae]
MKRLLVFFLLISSMLVVTGCGSNKSDTSEKDTGVSIRGTIEEVEELKGVEGKQILVEGEKEKDTEYDKASVKVTEDTKVFSLKDGEKVKALMQELQKGLLVEVIFVGSVAESYPVQATASQIIILK